MNPEKRDPAEVGRAKSMRDHFDCTPQQYHNGLDKLWKALEITGVQAEDVFTLAARELKRLRAIVDKPRPRIVCLCGSTRYTTAFFAAGWELTLMGQIVLSIGVCKHAEDHGGEALGADVAQRLDELHRCKIDLADWVLVLNVGGYYGESTEAEIEYARRLGKPVVFLNDGVPVPATPPDVDCHTEWWNIAASTRKAAEAAAGGKGR